MSKRTDWLPRKQTELYLLAELYVIPYVLKNLTRFGMGTGTPSGDWFSGPFMSGYRPFSSAFVAWEDPATRTPILSTTLKSTKKVFIPLFRELYRMLKSNPAVTDADLEAMHLPKHSTGENKPSPIAKEGPDFDIANLSDHRIQVDFFPKGAAHKKGKPDGQAGAEIRWDFSDKLVESGENLRNSVICTASPAIIHFQEENIGRSVYISVRWGNTRAKGGPFGDVKHTVVT